MIEVSPPISGEAICDFVVGVQNFDFDILVVGGEGGLGVLVDCGVGGGFKGGRCT